MWSERLNEHIDVDDNGDGDLNDDEYDDDDDDVGSLQI